MFGPWTSPTFRWRGASSISRPLWTGSAVGFSPGVYRSPWRRDSASRRLRRRSPGTADRTSSTPIKAASYLSGHAACIFRNHFAETVALDGHLLSGFDLVIELDQMLDEPALGCEDRKRTVTDKDT